MARLGNVTRILTRDELERVREIGTIESMVIGQYGYTVPWAIEVAGDGLYVRLEYTAQQTRGGTSTILIRRIGPNEYEIGFPVTTLQSDND